MSDSISFIVNAHNMLVYDPKYKAIPGYDGYLASVDGNIISLSRKGARVLTPVKRDNGYTVVALRKDNKSKIFYIHRLIALTFLKKDIERIYVNHKNSIRDDNRLVNLEWVTSKENVNHSKANQNKIDYIDEIFFDKESHEYYFFERKSGYKTLKDAQEAKNNCKL